MVRSRSDLRILGPLFLGVVLMVLSGCVSGGHYGRGYSAGFVVEALPYGYVSFRHGGYPHYFHDGRFYRRHRRGYVVVAPPRGAYLRRLPRGARSYRQGNAEYKEYRGVVYERSGKGRRSGYRVKGRADRRGGRRR